MSGAKETIAGGIGGLALAATGHPLDTVKVQLQTNEAFRGKGMMSVFGTIVQKDGVFAVYRGVQSPLVGMFAMNAVLFSAYGASRRFLGESATRELTVSELFAAGFIAGTAVAVVEGPVDFFKCQLQMRPTEYKGLVDAGVSILKQRGPLGAYQGFGPTVVRNSVANAFYYGCYEWARQAQTAPGQSKASLASWQVMGAGATGGVAYWVSTYPVDVIKSAIQSDNPDPAKRKYRGALDCARKLYAEGGTAAFFRGLSPCLVRAVIANAALFAVYEKALQLLG